MSDHRDIHNYSVPPASDLVPQDGPMLPSLTQAVEQDPPLASRSVRLWAAIVDSILLLVAAAPGGIVYLLTDSPVLGKMIAGAGALALFAYQCFLIATLGQTIAKRWMSIKIVRIDGGEAGFVKAVLLRSWVMGLLGGVPYLGSLLSIADALAIFRDNKRCLHDELAGTKVIELP